MKIPAAVPVLVLLLIWAVWPAEESEGQSACNENNTILFVTATDGGDERYTLGDGGAIGGVALSDSPTDSTMVVNKTPVPLRCRKKNSSSPQLTKGVTVCTTTSCDFSNGLMWSKTSADKLVCSIPAVNRDAGQLSFQVISQMGCRP